MRQFEMVASVFRRVFKANKGYLACHDMVSYRAEGSCKMSWAQH